jgi:hypothetical protein
MKPKITVSATQEAEDFITPRSPYQLAYVVFPQLFDIFEIEDRHTESGSRYAKMYIERLPEVHVSFRMCNIHPDDTIIVSLSAFYEGAETEYNVKRYSEEDLWVESWFEDSSALQEEEFLRQLIMREADLRNKEGDFSEPIELYTARGRLVDITNPKLDDIDFDDIGLNLGKSYRFSGWHGEDTNGGPVRPLTVAEHSVLCWALCNKHAERGDDPRLLLAILLHDAAEAFIGDIPRPLKREISFIENLEERILRVIFEAAGLDYDKDFMGHKDTIVKYDMLAFEHEVDALKRGCIDIELSNVSWIDLVRHYIDLLRRSETV